MITPCMQKERRCTRHGNLHKGGNQPRQTVRTVTPDLLVQPESDCQTKAHYCQRSIPDMTPTKHDHKAILHASFIVITVHLNIASR